MSVWSGLVGAGVSTLGNLMGNNISFSQQRQLANEQFEYNKQLQQMQMDYNNPVTQMSYWRQAGINPYAVLGNTTSISGSSVGQGSSPNLGQLGSDMMAAFNAAYKSDAERQALLSNSRASLSQSKQLDADALKKLSEVKGIDISNDILQSQAKDFKDKIALENNFIRSQIAEADSHSVLLELQSLGQLQQNKNYQRIVDQDIAESASRIKLMVEDGRLKRSQAADALASALLKKAEAVGVNLSNKTAASLALDYIDRFVSETQSIKEGTKHTEKENSWYEYNHTIGNLLSGFGMFYSPTRKASVVKGFR